MPRPGRTCQPDPWAAKDQTEFRDGLRGLMRWAGHGSLQQLEAAAVRRGTSMPVSTANRALNNDRLPTADFVERLVTACGAEVAPWLAARDALADRPYLLDARLSTPSADRADECPYPGLAAFTAEQAHWFFGREETTAELLDLLACSTGPVMVSGPSGTGKSSLLRAGLVPALADGRLPGSVDWTCALVTPTAEPGTELARCLEGQPDLIVVDQFEEVFTLCRDEAQRRTFIDTLCAHDRVVLGMRADFYGHCASYPQLVGVLRQGQVLLGPMTEDQLRAAMGEPAAAAGLELQTGLADVIIGELGGCDQPGVLPLLAHTLMATWRHRTGRTLTIAGYRLTGGVSGAIAKTAERAYQRLSTSQQEVARVLLLRMIQFGDGTADSRRHLDRAKLAAESADPVLAALIDARLVTADESTVVLAHEAILSAWPRLASWIEADRARLLAEQRLVAAAEAWERDGRHESDLYRGHRLAAVLERPGEPPEAAIEFVCASAQREQVERRVAARRTKRLRQMVAVLSCLVLLAVVMTVVAVVSRQDIVTQRDIGVSRQAASAAIALRTSDPDLAGQLAVAAYDLVPTAEARGAVMTTLVALDPTRSTDATGTGAAQTVAFSADGTHMVAASRDGMARVWRLGDPPSLLATPVELARHPGEVRAALFAPAGTPLLATSAGDGKVRLWPTSGITQGADAALSVPGPTRDLGPLAFSGDGSLLVTGAEPGGNVQVWNPAKPGFPLAVFGGHGQGVEAIAFTRTGRLLATSARDGSVKLWDLVDPARPVRVWENSNRDAGTVHALAFGGSDRLLVTGNNDMTATIWDVGDPRNPRQLSSLTGHLGGAFGVAFHPDGRLLATASSDDAARLWDVSDPVNPVSWAAPLAGDADNVHSVAFHPDGHMLATAGYGQATRLWETDIDRAVTQICGLVSPVITRAQWTEHLPGRAYEPPCARRGLPPVSKPVAAGTELVVSHSGKCLASRATETTPGSPVSQFRCKGLLASRWTFDRVGTFHRVRNTATNLCLDARLGERKNGSGYLVVQRECGTADTQLWRTVETLRTTGGEHVDIQLAHPATDQCLDVNQMSALDGALAIRWPCGTTLNQVFRVAAGSIR
nr:RICIN domain-containing protein [Kibdelosporangium sp. MJ126-NF4]